MSAVSNRSSAPRSGPGLDVLLLDGETRQALTCTRVLGRSGLRVGVATTPEAAAPAVRSRLCDLSVSLPSLESNAAGYIDELLSFLERCQTSVVVPAYDGSIEAIRTRRSEIEACAALAMASESALDIAVDKEKTRDLAAQLGIASPRSVPIVTELDIEPALEEIGLPAVMKPTRSWVPWDGGGVRLTSWGITTIAEAHAAFEYLTPQGGEVTLQQWLPGRRDAVTQFVDRGDVMATFAQTSLRELPRLGGVSVLCESIPLLDDIVKPAQRLVCEMGLEGCSIVEFRRDRRGKPVLMEVNPRIPGSIALAVGCGVDLPQMIYDAATGRPVTKVENYAIGRRLHWVIGDLWSLYSALSRATGPDVPTPSVALREFARDLMHRDLAATFDRFDVRPSMVEAHEKLWLPLVERVRQ